MKLLLQEGRRHSSVRYVENNTMIRELSTLHLTPYIEIPDWKEIKSGIVWDIQKIGKRRLNSLRTDIEKWRLRREIAGAWDLERSVLEYLAIDTYLGIDVPREKERVDFQVTFSLDEKEVKVQSDLYTNLFALYLLKNPGVDESAIQSWIHAGKEIKIEFWVSKNKDTYFIKNLIIIDTEKEIQKAK